MSIQLENPANRGIIAYFERLNGDSRPEPLLSVPPDAVTRPYETLGTHPDLVQRLWDELTVLLPVDCKWVLMGLPVLAHPESGVVFGFATGTHRYGLRLSQADREAALTGGMREDIPTGQEQTASVLEIGPEWVFGWWSKDEELWCLSAYEFAGR